jgi:SAM-dependent methyltransferase
MDDHEYDFPNATIYRYVKEYVASLPDLTGKVVLDIPCGDGRASYAFRSRGAEVIPLDLFPEFMQIEGIEAKFADLSERLPLDDSSVDYIICQEGVEHISDKIAMFREFNRVLKKGGTLIFTIPSISHLRGRLSWFLVESDLWKRLAPNEMDSVWYTESDSARVYFGHLFLIGVHHLLTICTLSGFETVERRKTKISGTSVFLGLLAYPILALATLFAYRSYKRKNDHVEASKRKAILWDRVKLNLSPTTLFCRHIFWIMRKDKELPEALADIKALTRGH